MTQLYSPDQAFKLAVEHFHAARFAEAEHIFRQLVAVVNGHESLSYFFGMTCCHLGKNEEGTVWLRKTLEINPAHAYAYANLGVALFKLGRLAEAEDSLRSALCVVPGLLFGWNTLEMVANSRGDWQTRLRSMERIAALSAPEGDYLKSVIQYIIYLLDSEVAAIQDILELMSEGIWARLQIFQLCLPFFQDDIHEEERQGLISIFNKRIEEFCLDGLGCLHVALLWRHLFNLGWYSSDEQLGTVCLPEHVEKLVLFSKSASVFDGILEYKLDSSRVWNERLFEQYILPLVEHSQELGCDWILMPLDQLNAFVYAQQPHTEIQARYCFEKLSPSYIAKGIRLGQTRDILPIPPPWRPCGCIFFHFPNQPFGSNFYMPLNHSQFFLPNIL